MIQASVLITAPTKQHHNNHEGKIISNPLNFFLKTEMQRTVLRLLQV